MSSASGVYDHPLKLHLSLLRAARLQQTFKICERGKTYRHRGHDYLISILIFFLEIRNKDKITVYS
jgi:hypothetical protein